MWWREEANKYFVRLKGKGIPWEIRLLHLKCYRSPKKEKKNALNTPCGPLIKRPSLSPGADTGFHVDRVEDLL